jgi:hypothetical protein
MSLNEEVMKIVMIDEGMKEEDEEMMKDEEHDGALLDR